MSYGRARAPLAFETPKSFVVADEFDQGAGALAGKSLRVGGAWSGAGDADDFQIDTTNKTAQRTAAGDSAAGWYGARFAIAGSTNYTNMIFGLDQRVTAGLGYQGAFVRYTDTNNWLASIIQWGLPYSGQSSGFVLLRAAGVDYLVGPVVPLGYAPNSFVTNVVSVDASGRVMTWIYPRGGSPGDPRVVASHALLASGATASGKPGIYDYMPGGGTATRDYDNVWGASTTPQAVLFASRQMSFRHDTALRQNVGGTSEGRVPVFEGKHLTLPPSTRANRRSRIVVKARRNDSESGLADQGTADAMTATLVVTPRVRLVSK